MMNNKKALIHIDYTQDFVASDGALTCGEPGQRIERRIADLTEEFIQQEELVFLQWMCIKQVTLIILKQSSIRNTISRAQAAVCSMVNWRRFISIIRRARMYFGLTRQDIVHFKEQIWN